MLGPIGGLEIITNGAWSDSLRKWHTVPVYKSSDGIRVRSQIARSLPFDFQGLPARWAAIHPRKQRSVPLYQFAIRTGFFSRVFSYLMFEERTAMVLGSAFFVNAL